MAITRSQIARQLLQQGGVPRNLTDARMQRTLEENVARNNAAREINRAIRSGGMEGLGQLLLDKFPQISNPRQVPGFMQLASFGGVGGAGRNLSYDKLADAVYRQNVNPASSGGSNFIPDKKSKQEIERDRIVAENQRIFREYMDQQAGTAGSTSFLPGAGKMVVGPVGPGTTPPETDQSLISRLTKLTPLQATSFDPFQQLSDIDQYTLSLAYPELMSQRRDTSFTPGSNFMAPTDFQLFQRRFGLKKGGMPTLKDAKENAPPGEFLAYINPKEADMLRDAGGSGIMTAMGIPSFVSFSDSSRGQTMEDTFSAAASGGASNPSGFGNDPSSSNNDFIPPPMSNSGRPK